VAKAEIVVPPQVISNSIFSGLMRREIALLWLRRSNGAAVRYRAFLRTASMVEAIQECCGFILSAKAAHPAYGAA